MFNKRHAKIHQNRYVDRVCWSIFSFAKKKKQMTSELSFCIYKKREKISQNFIMLISVYLILYLLTGLYDDYRICLILCEFEFIQRIHFRVKQKFKTKFKLFLSKILKNPKLDKVELILNV